MELWQSYQFLRFVKDEIKAKQNTELPRLLHAYEVKTGMSSDEAYDIWDGCVEKKFVEMNGNKVHILYEGRVLLRGRIGPISLELLIEVLKRYWLLVIVIFGTSSLYQCINWIYHLIK